MYFPDNGAAVRTLLSSRTWACFSLLFAVSIMLSCGGAGHGATGPSSTSSSSPGSPTPSLVAKPSTVSFGAVQVGSSQTQTGTLTASGSDVTVSSASWNGEGYSLSGITFPLTVQAGTSVSFTITFKPQSAGASSGQISFFGNASGSPSIVTLSGSGSEAAQHSVSLSWEASSSQVAGYNIYRSTQAGGPYLRMNTSLISGLSFSDDTVQSGATYYYAATSVDSDNVESGYSNIATTVIP
jgi:Abnormal spindle-like microcephaly-assoc'd, ASPM-SPD-2-Hydin